MDADVIDLFRAAVGLRRENGMVRSLFLVHLEGPRRDISLAGR
jgi:hypothetical protein